jgi:hypothetical protein
MKKFFGHSPPFMAFLNTKLVAGRIWIIENNILGGALNWRTDSG